MKLFVLRTALLISLTATVASAGPMGPIQPRAGRFSLGIEAIGENREMEWDLGTGVITEYTSASILARGDYGFTDRFGMTIRLGISDIEVTDPTSPRSTASFDNTLALGVGLAGIIYDDASWNLGLQGNYFYHGDHALEGVGGTGVLDVRWGDLNVGLQAQGKFDPFLPYVGVKYSDAVAQYDGSIGALFGGGLDDHADRISAFTSAVATLSPRILAATSRDVSWTKLPSAEV